MKQKNYLVVGLGGTGCAVVRDLKKRLYMEWRSRGSTGPYPEIYTFEESYGEDSVQSRVATVSIDSNEADLDGQGERGRKWRVFGETLRLRDSEKVLLNPAGIGKLLGSLQRYPGIEPWIGADIDHVREIARGATGPVGCNQIRRMGRLALANGNNIENVVSRIKDRLSQLSRGGQVGAEIHFAATFGCGTGSGTMVDIVAQVQKELKNVAGEFDIFIHGFATASDVGDVNTGNFYANQYAALIELNAFRLADYKPWDIRANTNSRKLEVPIPGETSGDLAGTYKSIALISETTEGGRNVPLPDQVEAVAEFLFQLSVRQMGDIPKPIRDALTSEDRSQYPADADNGTRATNFISYGVQRLAIPEREIREKLAYTFARQFVLQMVYNNWDGRFQSTPATFSKDGFVDARRGLWRVTRDHLHMNWVEDVTGERSHPTYDQEWTNETQRLHDRVKQDLGDEGKNEWIADFDKRVDTFWKDGFRRKGVDDYFRIRMEAAEVKTNARTIAGIVEKDLINGIERIDKEYPVNHLAAAIEYLKQQVEIDRVFFGEQATKAQEHARNANELREKNRGEFSKVGMFGGGKRINIFDAYRKATLEHYFWRTKGKAFELGQSLCLQLLRELGDLTDHIHKFDTRLKSLAEGFEHEIAERVKESEDDDDQEDVVYLVDAKSVNQTIRDRFENNKTVQERQAEQLIKQLAVLRGDRYEFGAYIDKMPIDEQGVVGGAFAAELGRIAEENAIEAHRKLEQDDENFSAILGQNIVEKLYRDYGGRVSGELEERIREMMERAMPMVTFDPNEEPMDLPSQGPVLRRCMFVPKCQKVPNEFEAEFKSTVESIRGGGGGCKEVNTFYHEIPEDRNPTEIVVLAVAFFFPARMTRTVQGLKQLYEDRVEGRNQEDSNRALFQVYTDAHLPALPDLMKESRSQVLAKEIPHVLLAIALNLMHLPKRVDGEVFLGSMDDFGIVEDQVSTGMRFTSQDQQVIDKSAEKFSKEVPGEAVVLVNHFYKSYNEAAMSQTKRLVAGKLRDGVDREALEENLKQLRGYVFLLTGSDQENAFFQSVNEGIKVAQSMLG